MDPPAIHPEELLTSGDLKEKEREDSSRSVLPSLSFDGDATSPGRDDHEAGSDHDDDDDDDDQNTLKELAADLFNKQNCPSRMLLTKKEHQWALAIKQAIESIPDLDNLSDFSYAQLALVCKDDIDTAIDKAFRHQRHKQENKILDTVEDALRNLPKDRSWISVDFNLQTGAYVIAVDATGVDMALWNDPDAIRYANRRMYYGTLLSYPDFTAMRIGSTLLCECEGYRVGGGAMITLQHVQSLWENFLAYPKKLSNVKFFNAPTLFKVMLSIAKASLPKEITSKLQLVPKCPLGRLDRVYGLPTPEIASERLQERMKSLARMRYANEKSFRLEPAPQSQSNTPAVPMEMTAPIIPTEQTPSCS